LKNEGWDSQSTYCWEALVTTETSTTAITEGTTLVSITDAAVVKAKALLEARELPDGGLRVFVAGGGCSGYQYGMALARSFEEDDLVFEQSGVKIVVDPESAQYLQGAEIDYVDDIMKSGFSIYNPNATKSCACGSSFQTSDGSGQPRACC
jgi:iron-sulfur cluster assembly protein